ncbi:hypothetical protein ACH4CC_35735 [Streptomyces lydicus]|uniref:hypothetical protein n=1 Tax=Streptomyces lydicus TaxID=47763 RepID=UPI003797AAED
MQGGGSHIGHESLADAVDAPREWSINQRLDTIERVLFALARAQGVDPDAAAP